MPRLGFTNDGRRIDLRGLLDATCSNIEGFEVISRDLANRYPLWSEMAQMAVLKYREDLMQMDPIPSTAEAAQLLELSRELVILANSISLMTLWGLSHYLKWNNFDIENPTDFSEVSSKLAFARNSVTKIGFHIASTLKSQGPQTYDSQKMISKFLYDGFIMGLALGSVTESAHSGQQPNIT